MTTTGTVEFVVWELTRVLAGATIPQPTAAPAVTSPDERRTVESPSTGFAGSGATHARRTTACLHRHAPIRQLRKEHIPRQQRATTTGNASARSTRKSRGKRRPFKLTNKEELISDNPIGVGTVVRHRRWEPPQTGTVVGQTTHGLLVAWHGTCVEDEIDPQDVDVVPDAPPEPSAWRGGIGELTPDGQWQVTPIAPLTEDSPPAATPDH